MLAEVTGKQMAFAVASGNRDKAKSGVAVIALHALAGYALLNAFDIRAEEVVKSTLNRLNVIDVPIPPIVADDEPQMAKPNPDGAASAANLKKTSAPREAPKRIVQIPVAKPVPAAPKAGKGQESDAGAAKILGPGTGAGGIGTGFGSGNGGDGTGGGGVASRAKLIGGRITNSDYPR